MEVLGKHQTFYAQGVAVLLLPAVRFVVVFISSAELLKLNASLKNVNVKLEIGRVTD
jgi:hypothetical protein